MAPGGWKSWVEKVSSPGLGPGPREGSPPFLGSSFETGQS